MLMRRARLDGLNRRERAIRALTADADRRGPRYSIGGPPMLYPAPRQRQRWLRDAVPAATRSQRCCSRRPGNDINGPAMLLPASTGPPPTAHSTRKAPAGQRCGSLGWHLGTGMRAIAAAVRKKSGIKGDTARTVIGRAATAGSGNRNPSERARVPAGGRVFAGEPVDCFAEEVGVAGVTAVFLGA